MTLLKKLGYAKESLTAFVEDALDGKELKAPDHVIAERRAICAKCEEQVKLGMLKMCKICGCCTDLKSQGKMWKCPKSKWPES